MKFAKDMGFYSSYNHKKNVQYFFEDGKITQIRFHLKDSNKSIKNKILVISKKHFKDPVTLFYEKHYSLNGKKIIEHYTNDLLETYYEIEKNKNHKITKGFSANGELFYKEKIEYDRNGKPILEEQLIFNADGSKLEYKEEII